MDAENEIQRKFTDLQGWMNQHIAAAADEVFFMVSGIAMKENNINRSRGSRQRGRVDRRTERQKDLYI